MPDLLTTPWLWLILGILLVAAETLVPGIFLIWFGLAALLTALVDWLFGWPWQVNLGVFALLAVACALAGWQLSRRRDQEIGDIPMLNRRAEALVGRVLPLDRAIVSGEGRVRIDDSVWRVTGPDLPAGTSVRITRVVGTALAVEPAEGRS